MFGNQFEKNFERGVDVSGLSSEEREAYENIIELLLTGGYFRARIQGLSRFDKITGGMAWCITAANQGEELDVDVFFKEESSLGERLAIAESIVKALIKMGYREKIDPHQIQGGRHTQDYIAILRVIRWLVKKVIETRKETGDLMKKFSKLQFSKERAAPEDLVFETNYQPAVNFNSLLTQRYKPDRSVKRKGRRVSYLNPRSQEDNIASCLLEYGEYYSISSDQSNTKKSKMAAKLEQTLSSGANPDDQDELRRQQLQSEMTGTGELDEELAKKFILGQNLNQLESQFSVEGPTGEKGKFGQQSHQAQVSRLSKQIEMEQRELNKIKELFSETENNLEEAQNKYNQRETYNQKIRDALQRFEDMVTPENKKQLMMLKSLVALNENLKQQEEQFRQNCNRCRDDYRKRIEALKRELEGEGSEESNNIDQIFQEDLEKLKKIRQELAKKNRNIVRIERTLDDIPGRVELTQYQRQFVELFDQISNKQTEHRQYTISFNTFLDRKKFIQKEVEILENIIKDDGWKRAMSTKDSKKNFLASLDSIAKSVKKLAENFLKNLEGEREEKLNLDNTYKNLLEKERTYTKLTKEFQIECAKNQDLTELVEELENTDSESEEEE